MTHGTVGPPDPHPAAAPAGRVDGSTVPSGPPADVTVSAERAHHSTVAVPVERVRLRKVVVSHEETVTVTVRREELRIERVDVPAAGAAPRETTAVPFDLVLHEERPVVENVVVPVERVHVTVDRIVDDLDVTTTLRHERVDVTREPAPRPPV